LELDLDVYVELLQPLLGVLEEQTNVTEEENNNLNVLVQRKSKLDFDCEKI
jgi:hypothetical protein